MAPVSLRRWNPPPQGCVKINTDAAIFTAEGTRGIGNVIRNANGTFIAARAQRIAAQLHPREMEALGLKEALSWTKRLGFKRCVFETDAKLLVDAIREVKGCAYFHTIVLDCVELLKHFDHVLVEFVYKSANEVAHKLARATHSMSDVQEWLGVPPSFIHDALSIDLI